MSESPWTTIPYTVLDALAVSGLPQMKLYCEIAKFVGARPEKGAAVVAAEYLSITYPDISDFSPRNLQLRKTILSKGGLTMT